MNRALVKAHVEIAKARSGGKLPKPPRQVQPDAIRRAYTREMRALVKDELAAVREYVWPVVQRLTSRADYGEKRDAEEEPTDQVGEAVDQAALAFSRKWTRDRASKLVRPIAKRAAKFNKDQINKQSRAVLGVDVLGSEPWLEPRLDVFVAENVGLIKSVPQKFFSEIETTVKAALRDGVRAESIAEQIAERGEVSFQKAKLIARDQIGKLNGQLAQERQTRLGVTRFIWTTMNDGDRVRDEHRELNNKSFAWDSPPSEGIPGEPINCRCFADPDFESVVA